MQGVRFRCLGPFRCKISEVRTCPTVVGQDLAGSERHAAKATTNTAMWFLPFCILTQHDVTLYPQINQGRYS